MFAAGNGKCFSAVSPSLFKYLDQLIPSGSNRAQAKPDAVGKFYAADTGMAWKASKAPCENQSGVAAVPLQHCYLVEPENVAKCRLAQHKTIRLMNQKASRGNR